MRKSGLLNPELARVITAMGHTDTLVVADAGLPIPESVERIDLALLPGVPGFIQTTQAILAELQVESALVAEEIKAKNPKALAGLSKLLGNIPLAFVPHEEFKALTRDAACVARTGECSPYANVILVAGVIF
ncbi:MAG: D-ribose pyranase [Desulfovibrio sp.]|nr:MAG: D-ribose pyranase [Desulfovibrio sp.]